jgi:hypothetical protein
MVGLEMGIGTATQLPEPNFNFSSRTSGTASSDPAETVATDRESSAPSSARPSMLPKPSTTTKEKRTIGEAKKRS